MEEEEQLESDSGPHKNDSPENEFQWDGNPNFFFAGDRIIPAHIENLEPSGDKGWCAIMPLGESGIELLLYAGDPTQEDWITLISDAHEEKFGHHLRVRPYEGAIVVSEWGDTPEESMLNMVFSPFSPRITVEEFLDWRAKLQQMPVVIDPDLRYWRPKRA